MKIVIGISKRICCRYILHIFDDNYRFLSSRLFNLNRNFFCVVIKTIAIIKDENNGPEFVYPSIAVFYYVKAKQKVVARREFNLEPGIYTIMCHVRFYCNGKSLTLHITTKFLKPLIQHLYLYYIWR